MIFSLLVIVIPLKSSNDLINDLFLIKIRMSGHLQMTTKIATFSILHKIMHNLTINCTNDACSNENKVCIGRTGKTRLVCKHEL